MQLGEFARVSLATLYVSRELARPLEQIRDYSLKNEERLYSSRDRLPENFQIREFNQLSLALNDMVGRLRTWGEEIVSAWKEAQNANKLKSEFLATTSHELRTPLNGIINCIRIVQDGYCDSTEEEREFLQQADDAAIHLLGIINDVLDISKIEAGKLSVTIENVELLKILHAVIDLHLLPIQLKDIHLKTQLLNENIYVLADPAKLKQVLINIVSNAVMFTDYCSIIISVKTILQEENPEPENLQYLLTSTKKYHNHSELMTGNNFESVDMLENKEDNFAAINHHNLTQNSSQKRHNQEVVITVEDTGIGIAKSQQSKLFNPFVMVDGSTTRKFGGTGLGLAISRNLLELMQGTISLESGGEAQGTIVKISLPLAEATTSEDLSPQIVE